MTNSQIILQVAVPRPLFQLLDYLPNKNDSYSHQVGCRVRVPFSHSELTGLIINITHESNFDELKTIIKLLDHKPLVDKYTLQLMKWASQYYHHPIGDVVLHAIPLALRGQRKVPRTAIWTRSELANSTENLSRAPKQLAVFNAISANKEGLNERQLQHQFGKSVKTLIRQLEKKSLIETIASKFCFQSLNHKGSEPHLNDEAAHDKSLVDIKLTDEQQHCLEQIHQSKPYLLHGVTGSGKTEVYLRAIEPLIDDNRQILIIVPEIGLTPQLLSRFTHFFTHKTIALMHSGLASGERMNTWLAAKYGQLDILIGTRSSIFVPMPKLAMIIVDEEHDSSLKQQDGFRYHARDLAVKRAHDLNIPVILGSATPSLETLYNSDQQRYQYLHLKKRPGARVQPDTYVQDIRGLPLESGICPPLLATIRQHIEQGNQVMLFLNRRGFAPALLCPKCGWHAQCSDCEANMTYHANAQKLICHRCDFERTVDHQCPDCGNQHITTKGQGTERIEQKLRQHFPNTSIIRIDRDTTRRRGELQKKLEQVNEGKPTILIGTQMLAKGHDFPNLTLVGILDVDQSLFSTDFRAWERLAQLILQVSGRAGRAEKKGMVMLQTTQPDHPFFQTLLSQGYLAIAKQSLIERKNWHFPPHAYQALLRANAPKQDHALKYLKQIKEYLEPYQSNDLMILGPAPSPIEKRANRFRTQLLITTLNRKQLHQVLDLLVQNIGKIRKTGGIRWSVDVDPIDYI